GRRREAGVERGRGARRAVVEVEVGDVAGVGDGVVLVQRGGGEEAVERALLVVDHLPLARPRGLELGEPETHEVQRIVDGLCHAAAERRALQAYGVRTRRQYITRCS